MKRLDNRVAAITGAGSGIGRATAVALAAAGCDVAVADIDADNLAETARLVEAQGRNASRHTVDVADRERMAAFARDTVAEHGGVHIVVNNAGVGLSQSIEHMDLADVEWLFSINWWGVVHGVHHFLPHLREADEAHIVNVSSVFGLVGVPTQSAYCAAKFAVRGFTESLRQELAGTPVGVTSVHPGGVATDIARRARFTDAVGDTSREESIERFERLARTTPDSAARQIVAAIRSGRPRLLIGGDARFLDLIQRLLPAGYAGVLRRLLERAGR